MTGIAENGAAFDSGTSVPLVMVNSLKTTNSKGMVFDVERLLARRLLTTDSCIWGTLQASRSDSTSGGKSRGRTLQRLPQAWNVLSELLEKPSPGTANDRLAVLLRSLEIIGQTGNELRESVRNYVVQMQLYSLLPLYLRVEQCSFESALDESLSFALQAVSLIDLDRGLEDELFELLGESPFLNQPPSVALQHALKVDLGELTNAFALEANARSKEPLSQPGQRIQSDRCIGYWSIVQQWSDGTAHLRIPSQLSIGKVLWPKVREHWNRLSQALLEVRADAEVITSDDDFIEIRDSNDPQLAETLDIQLQRCRETQGSMSLVVVKVLEQPDQRSNKASENRLPQWQETVIESLRTATDGQATRGFQCESNELTLVIDDLDRNEVSAIMREVIEVASRPHEAASLMVDSPRIPIVCGIACVASPSKRFQIGQLIHSAWRCLDAAKLQGPGTVKSIEVF